MDSKLNWLVIGCLALAVGLLSVPGKHVQESVFGHGDSFQSNDYYLLGTSTASSTLTNLYTGNVSGNVSIKGLPNTVISGQYTPKSYGSAMYLLVERSIDNGASYQPYCVLNPGTTQTLVYCAGASSTAGIPFLVPAAGTGSAASGTAIGFTFDLTIAADRYRVSAKESTTSTFGTLTLQGLASSN